MNKITILGEGGDVISKSKNNFIKRSKLFEITSQPITKSEIITFSNSLSFWHFELKKDNFSFIFFQFSSSKCQKDRELLKVIILLLVIGCDVISKSLLLFIKLFLLFEITSPPSPSIVILFIFY